MSATRRQFLKAASFFCAAAALGSQGVVRTSFAAEEFPGYNGRVGVLQDTTLCIGCRACEAACNSINNLPKPSIPFTDKSVFNNLRRTDAHVLTVVNRYPNPNGGPPIYRKLQCMHCNEPACASACFVAAFRKTHEGPVVYRDNVCVGCRYCMNACPFYVPAYDYDNAFNPTVTKCSMCYATRIQKGQIPACAEVCPTEALKFGERAKLIELAHQRIVDEPGRYVNHVYGENEVSGTGWLYLASVPFENLGLPSGLGTTPPPELTRDFLLGDPLVMILWPTILTGMYVFTKSRRGNGEDH